MADETLENAEGLPTVEEAIEAGLTEQEVEMATKQGTVYAPKKEEDKDTSDDKDNNDDTDEEEEIKELSKEEKEDKREVIKDIKGKITDGDGLTKEEEELVHKELSKEEKGFYFKSKKEKQKRQLVERQKELLEAQLLAQKEELEILRSAETKNEDADEDEYMTKAEAEEFYKNKDKQSDTSKVIHQKELEIKQEALNIVEMDQLEKDPDFKQVSDEFIKVLQKDKTVQDGFEKRFNKIGSDPEAEYDIIDFVYRVIERRGGITLDSNQEDKIGDSTPKKKLSRAQKVLKNSKKRKSSASVNSGSKGVVSEDDLTLEDVSSMDGDAWTKLKKSTRARLLGADPSQYNTLK